MIDRICGLFMRAREWHAGQTMTEYALMLPAVAIAVLAGYLAMGSQTKILVDHIVAQI